ncbi:MAG: hypothetical protein LBU55_05605 [Elusimicrobiota bacterium]|jgi:hypothetical protein|nr:hypothetical protein [Elusimicrobiota bacterium]
MRVLVFIVVLCAVLKVFCKNSADLNNVVLENSAVYIAELACAHLKTTVSDAEIDA